VLWQILGTARFTKALQQIQRHYGGGTSRPSITGPGLAGPGFYDSSCPA